jgi:hypothetical protein
VCGLLSGLFIGAPGCDQSSPPTFDSTRRRRVFDPPVGAVRPVPPHAIHSGGVGPYRLGAPLEEILKLLPHGPRVELMSIRGLVDYRLVRAESDGLIIGADRPAGVAFVAVLDREIARTASGMGVGATLSQLRASFGAERLIPERSRDPRVVEFAALPNTWFVLDPLPPRTEGEAGAEREYQVSVVLVLRSAAAGAPVPGTGVHGPQAPGGGGPARGSAERPARPPAARAAAGSAAGPAACRMHRGGSELDAVGEAVRAPADAPPQIVWTDCFAGGDTLALGRDWLALVGDDASRTRRASLHRVEGLAYAAPLDVDGDDRAELAVVASRVQGGERIVWLEFIDLSPGRMALLSTHEVYRLSARSAGWIGARLEGTEFYIQLEARGGAVEVTGLLLHRDRGRVARVAPLLPRTVVTRPRRTPAGSRISGRSDAGVEATEAGSSRAASETASGVRVLPPLTGPGAESEPGRQPHDRNR